MTLLLFLYFSLLFLYFFTTFSSIGTSTKKVQTFILFLVLVEQKVEVLNWAIGIPVELFFIFCNSTYIFVHSIRKLSNRSCQTVILTYVSMYYYAYAMLCHKKTHFLLISGYTSDLSTH